MILLWSLLLTALFGRTPHRCGVSGFLEFVGGKLQQDRAGGGTSQKIAAPFDNTQYSNLYEALYRPVTDVKDRIESFSGFAYRPPVDCTACNEADTNVHTYTACSTCCDGKQPLSDLLLQAKLDEPGMTVYFQSYDGAH